MIQFTLVRPGPHQFVLDRSTQTLSVTIQQRVLQFNLSRSTVVVSTGDGPAPEPDVDFLLAYKIAKL